MSNKLYSFINTRMKILLIVYEYQIKVGNKYFCPLNQQEISELVPCSKLKANQVIGDLISEGYLEMIRRRGRYTLCEKGVEIVGTYLHLITK